MQHRRCMATEIKLADALVRSKGDPDAFAEVYRECVDQLVIFMVRRVFDVETALDLAAESVAQAFLARRSFRGSTDEEAAGWLYGIARRQLALYFRRSAVEQQALQKLGIEPPRLDDEEQARLIELSGLAELRSEVRSELRRLSLAQRRAVELRVVDELPYPEVADRLGISQQAARARVARALKAIGIRLEHSRRSLTEGLT